jgi:hypothetical protein
MHCCEPDTFPHADTAEVRLNKASLARLSRVSKYIQAVAQPYVFHYYATGNMVRAMVSRSTGERLVAQYPERHENDRLPSFLRSIIQRPELPTHVKGLQLISSHMVDDLNEADRSILSARTRRAKKARREPLENQVQDVTEDTSGTSAVFRTIC